MTLPAQYSGQCSKCAATVASERETSGQEVLPL